MPQVVLQPCGEGTPAQHYNDTVDAFVPLTRMAAFLSDKDREELERAFPNGFAAVWGVTPGNKSVSVNKWTKMKPGDVALFARKGGIFSRGTVIKKIHNPDLARELWGEDDEGSTWEYVYFLDDIRPASVPYAAFNAAAGYKENNIVRGFNVLSEKQSFAVLAMLDLGIPETRNEIELVEIRTALAGTDEFDPGADGEGRKKMLSAICRRQGQPEFRKKLVAAYSGRCAISGCDALETLEAAHITPYDGPTTNHPANGLLLRADLHVLFDLGLIAVDADTFKVVLSPRLRSTSYAEFEGKTLTIPVEQNLRPNRAVLQKHRNEAGL